MCRAIKTLHNFTPPATDAEIRASSLQFVRKLSGFTRPSRANEPAFRAVDQVARAARELLDALVTTAPPRDRDVEASKARARVGGPVRRVRGGPRCGLGVGERPRISLRLRGDLTRFCPAGDAAPGRSPDGSSRTSCPRRRSIDRSCFARPGGPIPCVARSGDGAGATGGAGGGLGIHTHT